MNFYSSAKLNWKVLPIIVLGIIFTSQAIKAQETKADSIATSRSIFIKKNLTAGSTIYDYGQTEMTLEPFEFVTPQGSLYFSELHLEIPEKSITIYLSLNSTRLFLNKLYGIYQIDRYKDTMVNGSRSWRYRKQYYFEVNAGGSKIYFRLNTAPDNQITKSKATGGINDVSFTINEFTENRKRTSRVIDNLREVVKEKENDLVANSRTDKKGVEGYKVDYQILYDNGLEVYKSGIHDTKDLRILSDQKIGRTQRTIPISEFEGQFDDYTVVYDEQLNFYAQEEISISSVTEEIVSLVKQYNGDGILDLNVVPDGDTIYTTFSIVEFQAAEAESVDQDS